MHQDGIGSAKHRAFVDCGSDVNLIHPRLVSQLQTQKHRTEEDVAIVLADPSKKIALQEHVHLDLSYGPRRGKHRFEVVDIGNEDFVLGLHWIKDANV